MKLFELTALPASGSVRFPLGEDQGPFGPLLKEGFAVRAPDGSVRGYVNVCPHRAQPVDVGDGRLWLASGEIECQAHGARFDPSTGACTGGPCNGQPLTPLRLEFRDGSAWLPEK